MAIGIVYWLSAGGADRIDRLAAPLEQEVGDAYRSLIAAAEARNLEALFADVLENDRGALAVNGQLFLTRSAAREQVTQNFRALADVRYEVRALHVTPLTESAALLVATGTTHATTTDGRELAVTFVHSVVFVRENGRWKSLHSHQSTPRAP